MAIYIFSLVLGVLLALAAAIFGGLGWWLILVIPLIIIGTVVAVFIVFLTVVGLISLSISMKKDYERPAKLYMNAINLAFDYVLALLGIHYRVKGLEKLPEERFLLVANHISGFDPLLVIAALRKTWITFVSKPENLKIPIVRRYMHRCRHLFIDREDPRKALTTINEAAELISSDIVSVGIFPEGTRSKTGELGEFKNGALKIAQKAKCPIVVCTINGTDRVWKAPFIHTGAELIISGVLTREDLAGKRTNEISGEIRELVLRDRAV